MRDTFRQWLIRGAWVGLIATFAMWIGLQLGRPFYYTDGARELDALQLTGSGMWLWPGPAPECELPGPVQGRVAMLPDGRLIYGRAKPDGDTDLVTFDPQRPELSPEPVHALNTDYHELAPAVGADGAVYFASDRPGGIGGFDLYRTTYRRSMWRPAEPVPACNTMFDETDPAPHGAALVFARIDRDRNGGDDGVLFAWYGDEIDPQPLFGNPRKRRPVDRDPVFAPDGSAIWFVRKEGEQTHIMRSSQLDSVFDQPVAMDESWGAGALRSPWPSRDGKQLFVVRPGVGDETNSILLVSTGRELPPWWTGQGWIETLLLTVLLACLLLLLLLYLGKRWKSLDLVTMCLLLSLLVHLLLMLWLMGVEIVGAMLPGDDESGGVQVTVISTESAGGGATDAAQLEDLAATARFQPTERQLAANVPGAVVDRATAQLTTDDGTYDVAATEASESAAAAELRDAADAIEPRSGKDAEAALAAAAMAAVAKTATTAEAARAAAASEAITVEMPRAAVAGTAAVRSPVPAPLASTVPLPADAGQSTDAAPRTAMQDKGTTAAAAMRSGRDAAADLAQVATLPLEAVGASDAASAERGASRGEVIERPRLPGSNVAVLQRTAAIGTAVAAPLPMPAEKPVASAKAVVQDQRTGAPAAALAAKAAREAPQGLPRAEITPPVQLAAAGGAAKSALRQERSGTSPAPVVEPPQAADLRAGRGSLELASAAQATPLPSARRARMPTPVIRDAAVANGPQVRPAAQQAPKPSLAPAALGALAATEQSAAAKVQRSEPENPAGDRAAPRVAVPDSNLVAATARALAGAARNMPVPTPRRGGPRPVAVSAPLATQRPGPRGAAPAESAEVGAPLARLLELPPIIVDGDTLRPRRARSPGDRFSMPVSPPGSMMARAIAQVTHDAPRTAALSTVSPYSNRFGPAKTRALEKFGGTAETERAVRDGLRYLASIQGDDGVWGNPDAFDRKYGRVYVGKTALCVLAFLGAGHTPFSKTEYSPVVKRAIDHLLSIQDRETGAFGVSSAYGHGITTYALAECYGLTKDVKLRRPVENALSWILENQGPRRDRRNSGGWGYFSIGLQAEDSYARMSITAWMVMALESARMSGIELPGDSLTRARGFIEEAFDRRRGWFRYNHKRSRLQSGWPTLPASTPAGAFCLMLMGAESADEMVETAVDYTVERRPRSYRRYSDDDFVLGGQGNVYFWYYGTLCCFLAGGDAWDQWNERLRTMLPDAQSSDGSFAPIDVYSETAGDTRRDRSYTTAMCVLSLEVYYRYFTPLLIGR